MQSASEFLKKRQYFNLGDLPTEQPHLLTKNLSNDCKSDLPKAIQTLIEVDIQALEKFKSYLYELKTLQDDIQNTFKQGGRIFLCGCGATGRLSISIEYLWRKLNQNSDKVVSFMAGGDIALVSALEGFEDFPEYGANQLNELGFTTNDLLIGVTEGGETPFVIGAVESAAQTSKRKPWFLFCNPSDVLVQKVDRSKQVIQNTSIQKISLYVGQMAITGSTRMQASTILMLSLGLCMFHKTDEWESLIEQLINAEKGINTHHLSELIKAESNIYLNDQHTIYQSNDYAITVFTDTTERAPTFSLPPFDHPENILEKKSFSYVSIPATINSDEAWKLLLGRPAKALEWDNNKKTTLDYLKKFDFSRNAVAFRNKLIPNKQHYLFNVYDNKREIILSLTHKELKLPIFQSLLITHLLLKNILNIHSTLVMGTMGRFEGNVMTYVKPTNGKLIDRAARYIIYLLKNKSIQVTYEQVIKEIFDLIPHMKANEPIVIKVLESILSRQL